jgi:hypothetical protein
MDMHEITLFLNTTPRNFAEWLEKHTLMIHGADFPTERGRIALQRARSTGSWEKPSKVSLVGIYVTTDTEKEIDKATPIGDCIRFDLIELAPPPTARIEVGGRCDVPAVLNYYRQLLSAIAQRWPEAEATVAEFLASLTSARTVHDHDPAPKGDHAFGPGRPGHPGLSHEELIYRLQKAQEGEELKAHDRLLTWKEVARKVDWRYGSNSAGIKKLEDARKRLKRLQKDDPEGLLEQIVRRRKKRNPP